MAKAEALARLIRYSILTSTTAAGSGHPTSSLSAADLMTVLFFGGFFRFDVKRPQYHNNDRLIFSKGHASPLFYALWAAAGAISQKELMKLRTFGSPLEGHPTMRFPYTEAATGSLGQGLSVGLGVALAAKIDKLPYRTYVLLGDSEMSEGSVWEAVQLAAHYKLDNLIGVLDVSRLGQRGSTMYGHNLSAYANRISAFGWKTIVVDGHDHAAIVAAYRAALLTKGKPTMIIARTIKGKGISFLENRNGWHGRALKPEQLQKALKELGTVDMRIRGELRAPAQRPRPRPKSVRPAPTVPYGRGEKIATRRAYGTGLLKLIPRNPNVVVLDAEVSNSTFSELVKERYPSRFYEMYIAEQNMVGTALGLSRRGKIPFVSTFAAFFTRAFDQIRMSGYSNANIKFAGSHAGVSIGADGPSQMGLEDIAMFRTILNSVVLYPADAYAAEKMVNEAARHSGMVYIRTTRDATPLLYKKTESFPIGGSKVLRQSAKDVATVVAAGITVHEALAAYAELAKQKKFIRVIDLYSVKPLDVATLKRAARATKTIITVEDHYAAGGIGEAVAAALAGTGIKIISLAVRKMPRSGTSAQLLDYEGISRSAIVRVVKNLL